MSIRSSLLTASLMGAMFSLGASGKHPDTKEKKKANSRAKNKQSKKSRQRNRK